MQSGGVGGFELEGDDDDLDMDDLDQENLSSKCHTDYLFKYLEFCLYFLFLAHRFSDNKSYRRHKISSKLAGEDGHAGSTPYNKDKPGQIKYDHEPHEVRLLINT